MLFLAQDHTLWLCECREQIHRAPCRHEAPILFGDIVISDLSGKLEYTIKYPSMNGGQSSYGKGK